MSEATHDSFPDISSLQPVTDIELPTQFQISQDKLTLSGLINSQLTQEYSPIHVIEEDSIVSFTLSPQETLDQQDQQLEILLQHQVNDIQSIMNGFGNPDSLSIMDNKDDLGGMFKEPWVEIVEQPKSNSLRFRYECEGKGAGALQGKFSTQETKTFPKIKVHGFQGFATVVVSCVTHNQDPPKPHPHNLVSPASVPNGCKFGICTQVINPETMTAEFPHLGIQCVRRKDIKRSLDLRREKKVDPYRQGWKHVENPQNIDLNAVKLCFHVWYEADVPGKCTKPMKPVCSDPIYDAKAKKELQICDISDTSSPALGDKKIIILCEKISRDDIRVRFYDEAGWEAYANFSPSEVHKQYAISFKTPKYRDLNIKEKVRVQVELCKVNGETSEPQDFYYLPTNRTTPNGNELRMESRVPSYGEESCKQEIKLEDNSLYKSQRMQMIPRSNVGKSPYTHIQLGQQGGFVLAEKRDNGDGGGRGVLGGGGVVGGGDDVGGGGVVGVDQNSDFSLSNVQPFNPSDAQISNLLNYPDMLGMQTNMHRLQNAGSPIDIPSSLGSPNYAYQDQNYQNVSTTMYQDQGNLNVGLTPDLGDYYQLNEMTETVNNLSETLTQNMNIQQPAQPLQQQQQHSERSAGKRSQKDANLESGSLQLPYQQAKTDENKPNLSRQQSSLNTPTVSEQLTSSSSINIHAMNLAGGSLNSF